MIDDLQDGDIFTLQRGGVKEHIFKTDFVTEMIRLLGNSFAPYGSGGGSGSGSGDAFFDTYKVFSGIIQRTSNTTWVVMGTGDGHEDINLGAVTISGSTLLVTWDFPTPAQVIDGEAMVDETYVKHAIHLGTAMNATNMQIYSYMPNSGGIITCNGTSFSIATPAFDISDDGGKRGIYDVTWNSGTNICRVQFLADNTDMQWDYIVQTMNTTYNAIKVDEGTASGARGYVDIKFVDWAGNVQSSLNSAMKFSVTCTKPAVVNLSKFIDSGSNIFISGYVKI